MTHRIAAKFKAFVRRMIMPSLCKDCKPKIAKKFGLKGRIKAAIKRKGSKTKHRKKRGKLTGKAKAAFLRRLNVGRKKAGLKPIHAR